MNAVTHEHADRQSVEYPLVPIEVVAGHEYNANGDYEWTFTVEHAEIPEIEKEQMLDDFAAFQFELDLNIRSTEKIQGQFLKFVSDGYETKLFKGHANDARERKNLLADMFGLTFDKGILSGAGQFTDRPDYLKAIIQGTLPVNRAKVLLKNDAALRAVGKLSNRPGESVTTGMSYDLKECKNKTELEQKINSILNGVEVQKETSNKSLTAKDVAKSIKAMISKIEGTDKKEGLIEREADINSDVFKDLVDAREQAKLLVSAATALQAMLANLTRDELTNV